MNYLFGLFGVINEKAVEAKEILSSISRASIEVFSPLPGIETFSATISKEEFVSKMGSILYKTTQPIEHLLRSFTKTENVDTVFLIGGGTRMSFVVDSIRKTLKSLNIKGKLISRNNEEASILGSCEKAKEYLYKYKQKKNFRHSTSVWPFSFFYTIGNTTDDGFESPTKEYFPLLSADDLAIEKSLSIKESISDFTGSLFLRFTFRKYVQWSALYSSGVTDRLIDAADGIPLDIEISFDRLFSGLLEPSKVIGRYPNKTEMDISYNYVELFPPFSKDLIRKIEEKDDTFFHYAQASKDVISHTSNSLSALAFDIKRLFLEDLTPKNLLVFLSPDSRQLLKMRLNKVLADIDSDDEISLLETLTDRKILKEILQQGIPRKELYERLQSAICKGETSAVTEQHQGGHIGADVYAYETADGNVCKRSNLAADVLHGTRYDSPNVCDLWVLFDVENSAEIYSFIAKITTPSRAKITASPAAKNDVRIPKAEDHTHPIYQQLERSQKLYEQAVDEPTLKFITSGLSIEYVLTTNTDPFASTIERSLPQSFWNGDFLDWKAQRAQKSRQRDL
ncbi:hypothetical protein DI09_138p90 [Mitosporidium daphniae]|uniref:Uncharacterized protein n=1 Tax=Mitosporidium daphniae TaxID=1485682 RepID=A0A098VV04_9MICR|nr:uncharacterized protein DI09_138p90 [Mitosporidium daphniae]KGG52765.1 hypothetical protein DI09_138p90 [Mitosporidium daphniae]|eukprot:XP_013239201.1 uncharacterized protein DI09_138p90 [Mitosporidium daphniae]